MKAKHRLFAGLLLCAHAFAANADLDFPSVPAGGVLHAEFRLTSGSTPLGGIPITLEVPSGCGQVSPDEITTDSSGVGRFDFHAGQMPGLCRIVGRSGSASVEGYTTIYRPADLSLELTGPAVVHQFVNAQGGLGFVLKAGTDSLLGIPIALEFPATGASAAVWLTEAGNDYGFVSIRYKANGIAGIYDVVARAAGLSRKVRIVQEQPANVRLAARYARSVVVSGTPGGRPQGRLSVADGPAACLLSADYLLDPSGSGFSIPPGTDGFPYGLVDVRMKDCGGAPLRLKLEYPQPVPSGAQVWANAFDAPYWERMPTDRDGNSVIFTANGGGHKFGIAAPGQRPIREPPRIQDMWWAGAEENGWGMSIAQQANGVTFSVIYAYDEAGKPTWWSIPYGGWNTRQGLAVAGEMYFPLGTPWYEYDKSRLVAGESVGSVSMDFPDADHATISYSINGIGGQKRISRQPFGPPGVSPQPAIGGMWWGGGSQNGWGIAIMQQQATLFSVWFTYDESNFPTWFVMPGGAWSTNDTYAGRIYKTRGSPWLGQAYNPAQLQATDVGSFNIRFNGAKATLTYTLEGRSGTMALERQAPF